MAKIMTVEDSDLIRSIIKKMIVSEGHEVIEVSSGKDSILKYGELKPDIVFMDINLPDILGLDVAKEIIKQDPNAIIIMCSVIDNLESKEKAKKIGAKEYIVKPFVREQIVSVIQKYINKK
jgi:two-component system, chemotaxis family, chemotaxis protein CheY